MKPIREDMRIGVDMLNWQQIEVGDLVDVDAEYNFYRRVRISEKLEDVSIESGNPPGPGFVGIIESAASRGEEIVFPVAMVVPESYGKYAMAEMRSKSLADLLFEKKEDKDEEKLLAPGDLEDAFKKGPEGVRSFMDAQGNKDPVVQKILMHATEEDVVSVSGASSIPVKDLGPTQQFIDLMKSVSFPLGSADELSKAITSKTTAAPGAISIAGDAVLDGHHRWSGVYAITPDGHVKAKDFGFPGGVKDKLASAQLAVAAVNTSGTHPSKGGAAATDIIGKGKEAIVKMIDANKGNQTDSKAPGTLLNDKMMQSIVNGDYPAVLAWAGLPKAGNKFVALKDSAHGFENDPVRKAIADKVGTNLAALPSPLAGAPKSREDMPQLDHELIGGRTGLATIEKGLPTGKFNIVPPINPKEGREGDAILERWQRLAGLIKGYKG
jgi:hypothetical protein